MVSWRGERLQDRTYSIGSLPEAATEVFIRNMQSAYCDVTRHNREIDALLSLRTISHLGRFKLPELECLELTPATPPIKHPDWRQLEPEAS